MSIQSRRPEAWDSAEAMDLIEGGMTDLIRGLFAEYKTWDKLVRRNLFVWSVIYGIPAGGLLID